MFVKYAKVFKIKFFIKKESLIIKFNIVDMENSFEKEKQGFDFEKVLCLCLKEVVQVI